MADSEQKARRKLEEAEKKSRGGGGLLGKIFGGAGSDDAADLFIQLDAEQPLGMVEDVPYENDAAQSSSSDITVECDLCFRDFSDNVALETHYKVAHSYQCAACSKMFISNKALEIHSDETHCPFHQLRIEKDADGHHYKCYHENCQLDFKTSEDRNLHCRDFHNIQNIEVVIERRKAAKKLRDLERSLKDVTISSRKRRRVPRRVRFGSQEKTFQNIRVTKTLTLQHYW